MSDNIEAPVAENVADTATQEGTTTEATTEATAQPSGDWYDGFKSSLSEDEAKSFEKYKDGDSLKKGTLSAFQMIGKKGDIPSEGSTPEAVTEFAEKLGFVPSEEAHSLIELEADKWGDQKGSMEEMYNGAGNTVIQKAIENFRTNPSPQAFIDAVQDFIAGDAEQSLLQQVEGNKAMEEQFKEVASKTGLSPEALKQGNDEVIQRMGWDDTTTIHEIIHEFNKMTSNATTLQEAHLHNTSEGIDQQIAALDVELNDRTVPDAQHKLNVEKKRSLLEKQWEIMNRQ